METVEADKLLSDEISQKIWLLLFAIWKL